MLNRLVTTVLCFCQIASVLSAPLPWMVQPQYQPYPWQPYQQQMEHLQAMQMEQLQVMQMEHLQAMQMQQFPPPMILNWPQHIPMILVPVDNDIITLNPEANNEELFKRINDKNIFENERQKVLATSNPQHKDKPGENDDNAVVIEAEPEKKGTAKQRVFLLVPANGRFSIAGIIESIPFLPFEVNVPDSIAWAWNGISSIISGIGQRLPFRPKPSTTVNQMGSGNTQALVKNTNNEYANPPVVPVPVLFLPVGMAPIFHEQF